MEIFASITAFGFGMVGMIFLGMALFVKGLGSLAHTYGQAEAPTETGPTGSCFFTTMSVVLVSVSLLCFVLAVYVPNMIA